MSTDVEVIKNICLIVQEPTIPNRMLGENIIKAPSLVNTDNAEVKGILNFSEIKLFLPLKVHPISH